jgi:hypothetical protein
MQKANIIKTTGSRRKYISFRLISILNPRYTSECPLTAPLQEINKMLSNISYDTAIIINHNKTNVSPTRQKMSVERNNYWFFRLTLATKRTLVTSVTIKQR